MQDSWGKKEPAGRKLGTYSPLSEADNWKCPPWGKVQVKATCNNLWRQAPKNHKNQDWAWFVPL